MLWPRARYLIMILQDRSRSEQGPAYSRAESPDLPGEDAPLLMDDEREHPDDPPNYGVQEIEAVRSIWTPGLLKVAYLAVFVVILGASLESQASSSLATYVTSDFSEHALISIISICTSLIGGAARVPIAKLIDIWGRGEGYVIMVACTTLGGSSCFLWARDMYCTKPFRVGLILMAACRNVPVYAIAQVCCI